MQETEAQRDKLAEMRKEFERAEDRYSQDIERLTERLQNVQFQYEKAKTEKEKIELQSLKLTRDLERTTLDLDELRAQRGIEESTNLEERKGNKYSCNITLTKARGTKNRNYFGQKKTIKLYTENKHTLTTNNATCFLFLKICLCMKFQEFSSFCGNNFNVSDHNATAEEMKHLSNMRILCAIDFKMSTFLF